MAIDDAQAPNGGAQTPSAPSFEPIPSPATSEPQTDPDAATRSREAAGYRTRLREAEEQLGQRDGVIGALREEVDRLHRLEAERIAGGDLSRRDPSCRLRGRLRKPRRYLRAFRGKPLPFCLLASVLWKRFEDFRKVLIAVDERCGEFTVA